MKKSGLALLVLPALLVAARPTPAARQLGAGERAALQSASDASLGRLRAGSARETAGLASAERAALAQAQASRPELARRRGGDLHLSDRDLQIIAVVLLAVLVLSVL